LLQNRKLDSYGVGATVRKALLRGRTGERLSLRDVNRLAAALDPLTNAGRPAPQPVADELRRIDRRQSFTPAAYARFQNILGKLGVESSRPIGIPVDDRPYWMRVPNRLATWNSRAELPEAADIVIVGAGLTGACAAYYLRESARQGMRIVLIDRGGPAGEASGRNGGNFELLPENSVRIYEGLAPERLSFLCRRYPHVPVQILQAESERQASIILGVALRNRGGMRQIIETEDIDCDFSPRGWLYLAHTEKEEQAICEEVVLAAEQRQRIEIWSRMKIRQEFGFDRDNIGRFIPGDGSYHPYKFVCGVVECCLASGIELYTGVTVRAIESASDAEHRVETDRGAIVAGRVIVAANAFTARILPELSAIQAAQSQIAITEYVRDRCRGRSVTSEEGPVYFNQPRAGARRGLAPLLMGGGADRPIRRAESRRRSPGIHAKLLRLRERFFPDLNGRPFSSEWVGACGYTPDQLPVVGFLRPGVVVAGGFNGYGGSYCCASGQVAASLAINGQGPDWLPEDVFSPQRLLTDSPLFLSSTDGLWRTAVSLCTQLQAVNRSIADALSFSTRTIRSTAPRRFSSSLSGVTSVPGTAADARALRAHSVFRSFSQKEAECLLSFMRRWDLPRGTLLFKRGSYGDSCFVVLDGTVTVSMSVAGRERLLSTLRPGSIFGQIAMIGGGNRTATCATQDAAVLLEIGKDSCRRLFATGSPTALKVLAAVNEGLVEALRGASQRLLRLTTEDRVVRPSEPLV
jgi:glycine/D-amino acid oxidase-like deaminating enzyme